MQLSVQTLAGAGRSRAYKVTLLQDDLAIGQATLFEAADGVKLDWLYIQHERRRGGMGEAALQQLHAYFQQPIEPVSVLEAAKPFWARMSQKGYCTYTA